MKTGSLPSGIIIKYIVPGSDYIHHLNYITDGKLPTPLKNTL